MVIPNRLFGTHYCFFLIAWFNAPCLLSRKCILADGKPINIYMNSINTF